MRCAATIIRFRAAILGAALAVAVAAASGNHVVATDAPARVIVQMAPGHAASALNPIIEAFGGTIGRRLDIINAFVVELPARAIPALSGHPLVARVFVDRAVVGTMERTSATIGAATVRETFGYDGAGVGVAIIDSGVTPWHDDLASGDGGGLAACGSRRAARRRRKQGAANIASR